MNRLMLKQRIDNERYPHDIRIVRIEENANPFSNEDRSEIVLYEGNGRSYTDTTTEGDKNVDENKRKVSIPVRYDEWGTGKQPLDGDTIEVFIGNNKEVGMVKDSEPDNNRTIVYWNFRRV